MTPYQPTWRDVATGWLFGVMCTLFTFALFFPHFID